MESTPLIIAIICSFYCCIAQSQYKMGEYITCLEQNDEDPFGFKETDTYLDDAWCNITNVTHLCDLYENEDPYKGQGDVCDHQDPTTGITRNACKLEVTFGANETETKTWSWKCVELSTCVLKDANGVAIPGCYITDKRINCCCNDRDYCQDDPVYIEYAKFGRADHYPTNFTALLAINPGDNYVELDPSVPGYDTWIYGPQRNATTIDVAACDIAPNDRLLDVLIMVDGSCPMGITECEQQQIDVADTMAALRGTETYNIAGSNALFAQVKIGYIEFPTTGGRTGVSRSILGLDNDLNVNINDADQARVDIYDEIMSSNTMCIDPEQRGGNPNLAGAVETAFDIFDAIDDEGNSTSDKVILIVSNCGVGVRVDLCTLYEGRKRQDVKVIMINNMPDTNGSMADPEGYKSCLVDDDINRIHVVYDGDNYKDILPQIQSEVCVGNVQNITATAPPIITNQTTTPTNVTVIESTLNISATATATPTTAMPSFGTPTTSIPTLIPTTSDPTTANPTPVIPTTATPTTAPTTSVPTTSNPTTVNPTSQNPTTVNPTSSNPTTATPTTSNPTTVTPTSSNPTTVNPTTSHPTTATPTTSNPTTSTPTSAPTLDPTITPTLDPTEKPSQSPLVPGEPTVSPTVPTMTPSKDPSNNPTIDPTNNPTPYPTVNPTTSPITTTTTEAPITTTTINLIPPSTDIPSTAPTANIIGSPTISPLESVECDKKWIMPFKCTLSGYEIGDDWEIHLKSSFLKAFKQSIISLKHLDEWKSDWCVDIEMWFNLETHRRMLLETEDIEVEGSYTYNDELSDGYFKDYDEEQFNNEYETDLAETLDINKDDLQELTLESPSYIPSDGEEMDIMFIIVIAIFIVIICIVVVIMCIVRMRKETADESSNRYQAPTEDTDDTTDDEVNEEHALV